MPAEFDRDKQASEGENERVRRRAYEIWEREGRPHGREADHWRMAQQEVANEQRSAGGTQAVPASRVSPPREQGAARPQGQQESAPPPEQRSSGTQADPLGLVQGESAGFGAGISDHMVENTTTAPPTAKPKTRSAKPRAGRAKKPAGDSGSPGGSDRPR